MTLNAQDTTNDLIKKNYFPEKGDWAIGIDATPFFQYAGNLFTNDGNPYSPTIKFNAQYPNSIFFKLKTGPITTIRTIFIIGLNHSIDNIINTENNSAPHELRESAFNVGAIVGIERGKSIKNKLSSYYGIQLGVQKVPYINGTTVGLIEYEDHNDEELNYKEYGGNSLYILSNIFIGLEYYLFPRFAVSGEIGLGFGGGVQFERYRKRGTDAKEIIDDRKVNYEIEPGTSGNIGIFIYF